MDDNRVSLGPVLFSGMKVIIFCSFSPQSRMNGIDKYRLTQNRLNRILLGKFFVWTEGTK